MSQIRYSEKNKNPEVLLSIEYEAGILVLRISKIKELNVSNGKIYAKSVLSHTKESHLESDSQEALECKTEEVDATAHSSLGEMSVSKEFI